MIDFETVEYNLDTPEERVARGALWLDTFGPDDWWDRIYHETLNLWSADLCVLGQVFSAHAAETGDGNGYSYVFQHEQRCLHLPSCLCATRSDILNGHGITACGFSGGGGLTCEEIRDAWVVLISDRMALVAA